MLVLASIGFDRLLLADFFAPIRCRATSFAYSKLWQTRPSALWLHPISLLIIAMGKYFVTPTARKTSCGRFQASFAVQRTRQKSSYCRVFSFEKKFDSPEAANIYAVTQGWLHTSTQVLACWASSKALNFIRLLRTHPLQLQTNDLSFLTDHQ